MMVVGLGFRVANCALENAEVAGIRMTGRAHPIRSPMVQGEVGVIERGIQPSRGCVARRTAGREACRRVVRIRRSLVIIPVAAVAVGWQGRVVVVHMAVCA
jgi:hypothetical protein